MKQYLDLGKDILANGNVRGDRTGTGTISVFGRQIRFDLSNGEFPLLTTKKMFLKGIIHELLWFLRGDTNNNTLEKEGVSIWQEWAVENRRELTLEERFNDAEMRLPDYNRRGLKFGIDPDEDIKDYVDELGIPTFESLEGDGALGPIYGYQWRNWGGKTGKIENDFPGAPLIREHHDQISELIHNLKTKPFSRRHVVSAWNVEDLPDETISPQENVKNGKMALAPCHCLFQFYVTELSIDETIEIIEEKGLYNKYISELNTCGLTSPNEFNQWRDKWKTEHGIPKYKLSCQLYQRSADFPLGVPYNIASYALLTMMIAQCVDMAPGEFIHTFGDVHIYSNQIEKFKEQLERKPLPLPKMEINPDVKDIFSFQYSDFELVEYQSHPKIDYPISV